jgi:hypothetical protein
MDKRSDLDALIHRRSQLLLDVIVFENGSFQIELRRAPCADRQDQTAGIIDHYRQEIETLDRLITTLCSDE